METTIVSAERLRQKNWGYIAHSQTAIETEKKLKSANYPTVRIGDYITGLAGGLTPRGAKYLDEGVIFVRVGNVQVHGFTNIAPFGLTRE